MRTRRRRIAPAEGARVALMLERRRRHEEGMAEFRRGMAELSAAVRQEIEADKSGTPDGSRRLRRLIG